MHHCLCHHWARHVDENGRVIYACTKCPATVDWTAARAGTEILKALPQQASA